MSLSEEFPHPGQERYPDLKEPLNVDVDGAVSVRVIDGDVVFIRENEDLGDTVSIVLSEWDLGSFFDVWLRARMNQTLGRGGDE